jgi:hypothetical protein
MLLETLPDFFFKIQKDWIELQVETYITIYKTTKVVAKQKSNVDTMRLPNIYSNSTINSNLLKIISYY